jgi:hypothetical protein
LPAPLRWAGQGVAYAVLLVGVGYFATQPAYTYLADDRALLKLSFSHAGQPLKPCRRYTHEELTSTPFSERTATSCERGRWPVYVELDLNGQAIYRGTHEPAGLWNDGPSAVYARFKVPAGRHRLEARLRDNGASSGFTFVGERTVDLRPGENFVVDFRAAEGGFTFGLPAQQSAGGEGP